MSCRRVSWMVSVGLLFAVVGCSGADGSSESTAAGRCSDHEDVRYGSSSEAQALDLYLPARCDEAVPLVVYVHGGGFRRGDKASKVDDKVRLFTGEGWAFASVDYRLGPAGVYP